MTLEDDVHLIYILLPTFPSPKYICHATVQKVTAAYSNIRELLRALLLSALKGRFTLILLSLHI